MPFDFAASDDLSARGHYAYFEGLAAEDAVERAYRDLGYMVLARRWRGAGAEIDLILADQSGFIFVEVKKSRSHAQAAHRLTHAQMQRISRAGEVYASRVAPGRLVDMRLDLATVDGTGTVEILPNVSQY